MPSHCPIMLLVCKESSKILPSTREGRSYSMEGLHLRGIFPGLRELENPSSQRFKGKGLEDLPSPPQGSLVVIPDSAILGNVLAPIPQALEVPVDGYVSVHVSVSQCQSSHSSSVAPKYCRIRCLFLLRLRTTSSSSPQGYRSMKPWAFRYIRERSAERIRAALRPLCFVKAMKVLS